MFLALSVRTLRMRRHLKIAIGDAGNQAMLRAKRVHSNFAEYVPLSLLLIYFVETNGAHAMLVHFLRLCLLIGRASHAYGVSQVKENYAFRVFGMAMTFTTIGSASLYLLYAMGAGFSREPLVKTTGAIECWLCPPGMVSPAQRSSRVDWQWRLPPRIDGAPQGRGHVNRRGACYWITSSARSSSDCGIANPNAFAVLRLITSSNLVGCSMGRSPGLAPRRILSTKAAALRYRSRKSGP